MSFRITWLVVLRRASLAMREGFPTPGLLGDRKEELDFAETPPRYCMIDFRAAREQ